MILDRIRRWLSVPIEAKASATAPLASLWHLGQPVWTPRRYDTLAKEGFQRCAVVFRCVSVIARAAAAIPVEVWRGDQEVEDQGHPLRRLLARPNPGQAWPAFLEAAIGYHLLSGNTYIERVGPERGAPRELYALRPDRMQVIPDRAGVGAYRYEVNGVHHDFRVDPITGHGDILHVKSFNPLDDWYGMSPLEAAAMAVDQHSAAMAWNVSLLQNGARPSGALTTKGSMTPDQREALRRHMENLHQGQGKAGRPLVLEGDMTWQEMGVSPKDMDWLQGRHASARDIAMAFGVPSQLVGVPGDSTFANYEQARLALYEETVLPLATGLVGELSRWLAPAFGGAELRLDQDGIPALVERRRALWDKVVGAHFLTINEQREALGYARVDLPGSDDLWLPAGLAPLAGAPAPGDDADPAA